MRYDLNGTLIVIKDLQQVSDRFKKREFVVKTDEESPFPQLIPLQFTQDRCDNLDPFQVGDKVKVDFYIKGREWTSPQGEVKHFLSLDAWTIDKLSSSAAETPSASMDEGSIPPPPSPVSFEKDADDKGPDDDLPF
jgi:hypothetical protein